ncbi:MAG: hypothetical protein ACK5LR_11730 [Mangrovibacterium sp.]
MKNYLVLGLLVASTAFVACNNDDDDDTKTGDGWKDDSGNSEDGDGTANQQSAIVTTAKDFVVKAGETYDVAPLTFGLNNTINIPLKEGADYQAADVAVNGNKVYVAFNKKGSDVSGGVAYVSDYTQTGTVNYLTNTSYEINTVALSSDGKYLYAGGAAASYDEHAAIFFVFDVTNGLGNPIGQLELPSHVVKDIEVVTVDGSDRVFVATGATGYVVELNIVATSGKADITTIKTDGVADLRSLGWNGTNLYAVSGTQCVTYAGADLASKSSKAITMDAGSETATAGAQRVMGFVNGTTPTLAMGVSGIANSSGEIQAERYISSSVNTSGEGYTDSEYAVNALTTSGSYLIAAEGASGVVIRKIGSSLLSIKLQGALDLAGSANNVKATTAGDYIFVAAGSDGVKVLKTMATDSSVEGIAFDDATGVSTLKGTYNGYYSSIYNAKVTGTSTWNSGYFHIGGTLTAAADFSLAAESKVNNLTVTAGTTTINAEALTQTNNVVVTGGELVVKQNAAFITNASQLTANPELSLTVEGAALTIADGVSATFFAEGNVSTGTKATFNYAEAGDGTAATITVGANSTLTINNTLDLSKSTLVLKAGAKLVVNGAFNWLYSPTIDVQGAGASIEIKGNLAKGTGASVNVASGVNDFKITAASESGYDPYVTGGMTLWSKVFSIAE